MPCSDRGNSFPRPRISLAPIAERYPLLFFLSPRLLATIPGIPTPTLPSALPPALYPLSSASPPSFPPSAVLCACACACCAVSTWQTCQLRSARVFTSLPLSPFLFLPLPLPPPLPCVQGPWCTRLHTVLPAAGRLKGPSTPLPPLPLFTSSVLGVQGPWCMRLLTALPAASSEWQGWALLRPSGSSCFRAIGGNGVYTPTAHTTAADGAEPPSPPCLSPTLPRSHLPPFPPLPRSDSKTLTEARREQLFRAMGGPAHPAAPSGGGDGDGKGGSGLDGNGKGGDGNSAEVGSGASSDGGGEQAGSAAAAAAGVAAAEEATVIGWEVDVISAAALSAQMLSKERTSLNAIAFESTAKLIQRVLDQGVNIMEAYVDTLGDPQTHHEHLQQRFPRMRAYVDTLGDPQKHQERLEKHFPRVKFIVAKKADSLFPIVSAASIAAKKADSLFPIVSAASIVVKVRAGRCLHPSSIPLASLLHTACIPPPYRLHPSSIPLASLLHGACIPPPYRLHPSSIPLASLLHTACIPPPYRLHPSSIPYSNHLIRQPPAACSPSSALQASLLRRGPASLYPFFLPILCPPLLSFSSNPPSPLHLILGLPLLPFPTPPSPYFPPDPATKEKGDLVFGFPSLVRFSYPATKAWLAGSVDPVFGFPSLVRFSWATAKTIMDASCVPVHWEADEAEEEGQAWAVKQSSPAASVPGSAPSKRKRKNVRIESVAQKRHSFFRARKLQLVTTSL
ncbi:unnamed protein product [Closterium sp. NIES-65]|nr:unnamed protein product [Closterium sp. NIES-65]